MTRFSLVMAHYGTYTNNNIGILLSILANQTFKDFEVVIAGSKVLIDQPEQIIHGVKVKNVVIENDNHMGRLTNAALNVCEGEYIQLWSPDLVCYPDYLEKLNKYIKLFGKHNLYSGNWIDVRGIHSRNISNFFLDSYDEIEGIGCFHRDYIEPYNEEFESFASHYTQELYHRLWKKLTFIYLKDLDVIHIPHLNRATKEQMEIMSRKSDILYRKLMKENDKNES